VTDSNSIANVSGVYDVTSDKERGPGEFVALSIDRAGLHSFDGRRTFDFALVNVGGLMYFGHGEKLTRFD
jgi:hypothetical protein